MNNPQTPPSSSYTVQVPITRLDEIKMNMQQNRANHVSEIFAIYDQLPELLAELKKENLTEDQVVEKLGTLIENVFKEFELSQLPMAFQLIKEKGSSKKSNIIIP